MKEFDRLADALTQVFGVDDETAGDRAESLWRLSGLVLVGRWSETHTSLAPTEWKRALLTLRTRYKVGSDDTVSTEPLVAALLPGLVTACRSTDDKRILSERVAWTAAAGVIASEQQASTDKLRTIYVLTSRDQVRAILRHDHD